MQSQRLPGDLASLIEEGLERWRHEDRVRRLWAADASLWTGQGEERWLGWLRAGEDELAIRSELAAFAREVRQEGFTHVLLIGMGGSSLCPDVMRRTFGRIAGWPDLHVLDSTDPAQISACEKTLDLAGTLVIVSSKSGGTLEPDILRAYFFERVGRVVGAGKAGSRFIAVTDPGSALEETARADGFRRVFHGVPSIGGRYSALSNFGMVPAAAMGVDTSRFLDRAGAMAWDCRAWMAHAENPGVALGVLLGCAAVSGRDKLTLTASPALTGLGAWLEQLVAESTGKGGKGLIPIDGEELAAPDVYGSDRVFVHTGLAGESAGASDAALDALAAAGHPVARITIEDIGELGREFFRWEFATAVAGSIMGINPFDQPDVEASKVATKALTAAFEKTGSLPSEAPLAEERGIKLFADAVNADALKSASGKDRSLKGLLAAHLGRLGPKDYFCLSAFLEMSDRHQAILQEIRHAVRDARNVGTCLGYGPRFLHSTGQAYKGGPNTGVFLQVTCDDGADLPVPGRGFTFGIVKQSQARGDFQVLAERGRRILRAHLGADVTAGLSSLRDLALQVLR